MKVALRGLPPGLPEWGNLGGDEMETFADLFDGDLSWRGGLNEPEPTTTTCSSSEPDTALSTMFADSSDHERPLQTFLSEEAVVVPEVMSGVEQNFSDGIVGTLQGLLVAPTNASDQGYVNVFMVIDPNSMTYFVPKQVISYKPKNDVVTRTVFGPKIINNTPPPGITAQAPVTLKTTTSNAPQESDEAAVVSDSDTSDSSKDYLRWPSETDSMVMDSSLHAEAIEMASQNKMNEDSDSLLSPITSTITNTSSSGDVLPPLRALSAYNFFFRDERERILDGVEPDWSESKQQRLLGEHWFQDRSKKRRHRKTHGKIDFTSLSKLISSRWKELPDHRKDFYRQIASRDFARFKQESRPTRSTRTPPVSTGIPQPVLIPSPCPSPPVQEPTTGPTTRLWTPAAVVG